MPLLPLIFLKMSAVERVSPSERREREIWVDFFLIFLCAEAQRHKQWWKHASVTLCTAWKLHSLWLHSSLQLSIYISKYETSFISTNDPILLLSLIYCSYAWMFRCYTSCFSYSHDKGSDKSPLRKEGLLGHSLRILSTTAGKSWGQECGGNQSHATTVRM